MSKWNNCNVLNTTLYIAASNQQWISCLPKYILWFFIDWHGLLPQKGPFLPIRPCLTTCYQHGELINTLRPRQDGRPFPDDIFKWIFVNEIIWISNKISLKFVPRGPINNIRALVQIMAWRRPGDKPLSEPMMVSLLTHICVTRAQWVKTLTHCQGQAQSILYNFRLLHIILTKW